MKHNLLIIEDDKIMRVTLTDYLRSKGHEVVACPLGKDGITVFHKEEFSLVISDVMLPDMNGLDILQNIKEKAPNAVVLIITAYGTIKDAVEALKLGAFDYITKPFALEEFNLIINRALEVKELRDENIRLKKNLSECFSFPNIIGDSPEMNKVYDLIGKVSKIDSTVLILGESGTGKELVSSTIHYQSDRKKGPFIKVNCAALPENLVESELFGVEKGAFTGADRRKPGRFERADKGTIFLDEIGDLSVGVQTKLLRVLQDGSFERVGGTQTLKVDVRVITATNKDIEKEVQEGGFREDLYYRLNVIPIRMPALRDRKEDISPLIDSFLANYNCTFGKKATLSSEVITDLFDYDYPGNVRELKNILERLVGLASSDVITTDSLPKHVAKQRGKTRTTVSLAEVAAEAEKGHIMRTLKSARGNKTRTAELLGISRKTLWEKIKLFDIEKKKAGSGSSR
ncbi:MAG: sigma-54-dependent Fis family transcriptional regulator [Proteobacteria bacterium]|nr:sigma-54-dependent Fis family transcriptional regulator [Pseudomonadota bacterium]